MPESAREISWLFSSNRTDMMVNIIYADAHLRRDYFDSTSQLVTGSTRSYHRNSPYLDELSETAGGMRFGFPDLLLPFSRPIARKGLLLPRWTFELG